MCGAVRYEGRGMPFHVTHCHCEDCRRSSGAAFVTWASFRSTDFAFVKGQPRKLAWEGRERSFCPVCGTHLTFQTGPGAEEVGVTVGSFDHPEEVVPESHTWVQDRVAWVKLADGLPVYARDKD